MNFDIYQLPALKQMENLAREKNNVVSLSQGIPFISSDDSVRLAVIDALLQGKVDRYSEPQGLLSLRKLLSQKLAEQSMEYSSDEVLVTAGAIEALSTSLLYLAKEGAGEIIIPTPTYASYFRAATVAGLTIKPVQLDEQKNWKLDLEKVEKLIFPRTKAVLLCSPNNPTGNIYDKETLLRLCELAKEHNIVLLVDEVYGNIHWQKEALFSPAQEVRFKKHIIRIVSFSKDFSVTGWRIGFLHTDTSLIKKLLPVHDSLVNCAPVISQYAATACLLNEERIRDNSKKIYTQQRQKMGESLEVLSKYLSFTYPQGSYFFFPKIKGISDDVKFCLDLLDKAGVAVVPGSDFGLGGEGHIRLCFGRSPEEIDKGMERLTNYLRKH